MGRIALETETVMGELPGRAVELAEWLLRDARARQTAAERSQARRLARMIADPRGKALTIAVADQAFRSQRPARIAEQLRYLLGRYGVPRFLRWWDRAALALGGAVAGAVPRLVVPAVVKRLERESRHVILPAEEAALDRYLAARARAGLRPNLNLLGEAVLGEAEAARRLEAYEALLGRDDVECVSVKLSSIVSQIDLVGFDATIARVSERLRALYRAALRYRYLRQDGGIASKLVTLDMEEYRDLDVTVAAFCAVLDEPEFLPLTAGIVLQAYLPDSYAVQRALTAWAAERCARGGAPIRIRIVKGANLAMERIEADRHRWAQAPFETKLEVDANYKRMLDYGCDAAHARVAHLGVGSHNLFDIAYALLLREARGVESFVEFEMLEGMANHQARAVGARAGGLLLYAPLVKASDFHTAIAYLVRRLDENTAPQNFLRHVFDLEPGSAAWASERDRFLAAFAAIRGLPDRPRRTQDRAAEARAAAAPVHPARFHNEPDTDWTLEGNRAWIDDAVRRWREAEPEPIALQIGGRLERGAGSADGRDPSRPGRVAYHYALAGRDEVERALAAAVAAWPAWAARPLAERRALLDACAAELGRRRGELIGAMMLDGAKTVVEADPEVSEAIDFARYYPRAVAEAADEAPECRGEPVGVVVIAPPWNFPLSIPAGGAFAALAAGNAVILKPAPEAVLVGWHLARCAWAAGIPREALQFLPCPDDDVGRALVTDARVGAVVLTGSVDTARLFLEWRADLRLFAETSGKNAVIVTSLADRDQAAGDIVRSAFGHNGQKCSAASLAILEAEVYDDPGFLRQLRDAAASLPVGGAWDPASRITPLVRPPGPALARALTQLDPGEEWVLAPVQAGDNPELWSPGIKRGVAAGSHFHRTECFGPILGLMRAGHLDEAIDLANGTPFGLTSGIQSLDDREIARWRDRVEAGTLYVNRPITGAMVCRQPFGGWKASSVGPGAKAGGPNYALQLAHWRQVATPRDDGEPLPEPLAALLDRCFRALPDVRARELVEASARSYARAVRLHFGREHDPSALPAEENLFRYRPCREVMVRAAPDGREGVIALCQVLLAARAAGTSVAVSAPAGSEAGRWRPLCEGTPLAEESSGDLAERLGRPGGPERLRGWQPLPEAVRIAANRAGIAVIDAPVLASGRLELRWYLREQTVSRVRHRHGSLTEPAATE